MRNRPCPLAFPLPSPLLCPSVRGIGAHATAASAERSRQRGHGHRLPYIQTNTIPTRGLAHAGLRRTYFPGSCANLVTLFRSCVAVGRTYFLLTLNSVTLGA